MKAKWGRRMVGVVLLSVVGAGCGPSGHLSPQVQEILQAERRAPPVVGGPSEELSFGRDPAGLLPVVQAALKDAGVRPVREGSTEGGPWLLGESMADRQVLVRIQPVYPGRSRVKLTVQGNDALATELLQHLRGGIVAQYGQQ